MKNLKSQIIAISDIPNKNNRIYPKEVLEKVIEDFENNKEEIFGYIGMPLAGEDHIHNISHVIKKLYMSNNCLIADIKILDTPKGIELLRIIKEEEIVFRLKGIAKTEKISGNYLIKKGYKLLSINAVNKQEAA